MAQKTKNASLNFGHQVGGQVPRRNAPTSLILLPLGVTTMPHVADSAKHRVGTGPLAPAVLGYDCAAKMERRGAALDLKFYPSGHVAVHRRPPAGREASRLPCLLLAHRVVCCY